MPLMSMPDFSAVRLPAALTGLCVLMLSGCAPHRVAVNTPSEPEVCASLQDIVAQADVRFAKFKTTPTIDATGTRWETKPVFPESQCEVVEWGGGRINYICTWHEGDESAARETYQQNAALIGRCLGGAWSRSDSRGQTGEAAWFRKGKERTSVVMRYFKPRAGYSSWWETSLTIGDDVTPDAR